ncbi:protein REVEILLE 6-like isoform X3 [Salvia hispanica]|uniref:protein REVEILLE 6-like isoform X3 n=1 Tax=Salvia hispanica TaxID=49212 RepID=UPI00200983B8|nr:protein REVEILLE 6-like isoform X3 [Salvia hispanica]
MINFSKRFSYLIVTGKRLKHLLGQRQLSRVRMCGILCVMVDMVNLSKFLDEIRSHAQKYFLKVQKNGTSEHVPPPRPKRKAAHPYPQKATKNVVPRTAGPGQSSVAQVETGYAVRRDPFSVPSNPISSSPLSSWSYNVVPAGCLPNVAKDNVGLASVANNYSSSSNDSTPRVWKSNEMDHEVKVKQCNTTKDMPDFAQVYGFIGSVFDPTATDHLRRLRKMEPINVETVLMLMKNLCVNLATPEFEDHRKLLSSYKVATENVSAGSEIQSA